MQERQVTLGETTLPARGSVLGAGDAESDRAGRRLCAARGAARSVLDDAACRRIRTPATSCRCCGRTSERRARAAHRAVGSRGDPRTDPGTVYVDDRIREYIVRLGRATRDAGGCGPARAARDDHARHFAAVLSAHPGARPGQRVHRRAHLRASRRREGRFSPMRRATGIVRSIRAQADDVQRGRHLLDDILVGPVADPMIPPHLLRELRYLEIATAEGRSATLGSVRTPAARAAPDSTSISTSPIGRATTCVGSTGTRPPVSTRRTCGRRTRSGSWTSSWRGPVAVDGDRVEPLFEEGSDRPSSPPRCSFRRPPIRSTPVS